MRPRAPAQCLRDLTLGAAYQALCDAIEAASSKAHSRLGSAYEQTLARALHAELATLKVRFADPLLVDLAGKEAAAEAAELARVAAYEAAHRRAPANDRAVA